MESDFLNVDVLTPEALAQSFIDDLNPFSETGLTLEEVDIAWGIIGVVNNVIHHMQVAAEKEEVVVQGEDDDGPFAEALSTWLDQYTMFQVTIEGAE